MKFLRFLYGRTRLSRYDAKSKIENVDSIRRLSWYDNGLYCTAGTLTVF